MTLLVDLALLDQAVALEALEGVVDLADVQRPGRAGAAVELGTKLVAVAGALVEDGEQTLTDGHVISSLASAGDRIDHDQISRYCVSEYMHIGK
ncbi:hypothetical protein GCM10025863_13490 [Microbacterium suwonense]|uniref:Uncharacterized protein n=1 Tax=Microbacterium suwonense TaxID=683047 RepID=A0ABM8FT68_9MICO|nr:hypothetical protein GCM10025863_13490 [Microbacterium suwonense]